MLSRLKKINPDLSASSIALVIAMLSVFIALGSDNAPCLSANATCTVGQNPEFTGDIDIKSDTIYNATIGHNLSANATYSLVQPGYNHTGNLAVIDSANDLNVGGAVVLGTSATSTLGAIRFDSNKLQVYDSSNTYVDVGSPDQNVFTTINGNSGNLTASTTNTSIKIQASADSGLTVVASGDKLEIQSAGGGSGFTGNIAEFYPGKDTGFNQSGVDPQTNHGMGYDGTSVPDLIEKYDIGNCFSANTSGADPYHGGQVVWVTYDHATCGSGIYKIEAQIGFEKTTQNFTQGQRQTLYAELRYYESSSSGQLISRTALDMTNYNQYSQATTDGFHILPINAVVCMGYETSQDNKFAIYMMSSGYGIIKGGISSTGNQGDTFMKFEKLDVPTVTTCNNMTSPYPNIVN